MAKLTDEQKRASAEKRAETIRLNKEREEAKRIQDLKDHELAKLRTKPESAKNNVKYHYKVGDMVKFRSAHFPSGKVLEILDMGSILLVEHDGKKGLSSYYYSHLDVIPESLELAKTMSYRDSMNISFHNGELDGLLSKYYYFGINMNPEYQRGLVWNLEDKQSLIHSIFNNIEIGKFVFITLPYKDDSPAYEILDGLQRLSTIIEYYEDRFTYKGLFYSQLSERDKGHFRSYSVTSGDSREDITLEQKLEYFLKLNTQGKPQSPEHIHKVETMLKKIKG